MKGGGMSATNVPSREVSIKIEWFSAITEKPDEFVEELENLCKKFCPKGGYYFTYSFED
jgi:hypothetical protein